MDERNFDISVEPSPNEDVVWLDAPVASNSPTTQKRAKRRPRLSKVDKFKQNTLPFIILATAAFLIVVFIIGSITRGFQRRAVEREFNKVASESIAAEESRLEAEMNSILKQTERMAAGYDFDGAIALIDTFSGNIGGFPKLLDAKANYETEKRNLVAWEDPNTIVNLSFQTLIADTQRAFSHYEYSYLMQDSYMTTTEFQKILEQLYSNNYILVGLSDFIETATTKEGKSFYQYKTLMLPEGKKPLVLTQTNVNYNLYLVDSDGDMIADADGVGIASKLVLDSNGNVAAELVNADSSISTGAFDLVPILDAFVEEHPDFSYHGAKAVLALTGYNGLFGYRTDEDGRDTFGEEQYNQDVAAVQAIANKLKETGYELACYTYGNNAYGDDSLSDIQTDMNQWTSEVFPILGSIDIMVLAQGSDISDSMLYSGEKFDYLKSLGFNYFIGYCDDSHPFTFIAENYIHQGRLPVSKSNIDDNGHWFSGIMDTEKLLDSARYD